MAKARNNSHQCREERRKAALARQEKYEARTPVQIVAKLDETFGKGEGAARERKRLQAIIDAGGGNKPLKAPKKKKD